MARVKVKLADNIARVVFIETGATIGATIGTDLKLPSGAVATVDSLRTLLGVGDTTNAETEHHRLLQGLTLGDDHPQYTRKDTLTTRGDLYFRDADTVARLAKGADRTFLRAGASDPAWEVVSPVITLGTDLSGNVTLTNLANGTLNATVVNNAITDVKLRDSAALSVIGRASNSSGDPADIASSGGTDVLRHFGTSIGFGSIDHTYISDFDEAAQDAVGNMFVDTAEINFTYDDAGAQVTATLIDASVAFARLQNISTSRILGRVSASTGSIEALTGAQAQGLLPGAALTKNDDTNVTLTLGGSPTTSLLTATSLSLGWTGQLAVTRGGTGLASVAQGDLLYGSAANTVSALAKNATASRYLSNSGTSNNPAWAQVDLSNGVTGRLPFANAVQVATSTILGRVTASTGDIETLTGTQATTLLDAFTSVLKGLAPASGGGTTNFLRADGTWAAPSVGGTPGGSTTQIQFNDGGAFGGDADFTWDKTNNILTLGSSTTPGTIVGPTAATTTSTGVTLNIKGSPGGSTSGTGGQLIVSSGAPTDGTGGTLTLKAVNGATTTATARGGGSVSILSGDGISGGAGGLINLLAGGGDGAGQGGSFSLQAGGGGASGNGGNVSVTAGGGGGTSGNGGSVTMQAASAFGSGNGGGVTLQAGDAAGTNKNGGNIALRAGTATGSGTAGLITLTNLTTTGAQTATFTATNKPGTGTTAPSLWLRVAVGAVNYYIPMWQ